MSSAWREVTTVAAASLRIWQRELAKTLGVSHRAVVCVASGVAVLAIVLSVFLYWLIADFVGQFVDAAAAANVDTRALLCLVFAGVFGGTATYQLVLCVTTPDRSGLDNVISLTPIRRHSQAVGTALPIFGIGFAFSLVVACSTLAIILVCVDTEHRVWAVLGLIWLVATTSLAIPGAYLLLRALFRRLRLPGNYGIAVAAALTAGFALSLVGGDLIPRPSVENGPWWTRLTPTRALAEILRGGASIPFVEWGAALIWTGFVVVIAVASMVRRENVSEKPTTRVMVGVPMPPRRFLARTWSEVIAVLRLPQCMIVSIGVLIGTIVIILCHSQPEFRSIVDRLVPILTLFPASLGMYSFGSTYRTHWIGEMLTANTRAWVLPKMIACVAIPAVLVTPFFAVVTLIGMESSQFIDVLSLDAAMIGSAMLCGLLVPFEPGQTLSATVTSITNAVFWAVTVLGLRYLDSTLQWNQPVAVTFGTAVVLLGAYVGVACTSVGSGRVLRA